MPIYTVRLFAESSVRLTERPYAEATLPTFTMNFPPYFSVTAIDNVIDHGGVQVPKGLTLNVQVEANGLPIALEKATQAATYFLSTLSCTCNAAVAQPKPLWAYDATPDLLERELLLIIYDYNININTRRLLQASWEAVLNGLFHGVWLEGVTSDESQRMQRAVQSVRRGLADTDDVLDEFLIHWSSLETLDVVYKRVFHHQAMYTYKTCGNCDMAFEYCPKCGDDHVFRGQQRYTGIEEVFATLHHFKTYNKLKRLRNGISHGYLKIDECMATAKENIELVRKAVLTMLMRIVGVADDVQALVLEHNGLKRKVIPEFRIYFRSTFDPGDPTRFDTHPQVEIKEGGIEVKKYGVKLVLNPTWIFTYKNCPVTPLWQEFWGDEAAGFTIEEGVRFEDV